MTTTFLLVAFLGGINWDWYTQRRKEHNPPRLARACQWSSGAVCLVALTIAIVTWCVD